jgi:hypothetical protein
MMRLLLRLDPKASLMTKHFVPLIILLLVISLLNAPIHAAGLFIPAPGSPFSTGDQLSNTLTAADFNRDGNLDVVTANYSMTGSVSILLGNGTGSLALAAGSPFVFSSGARAYGVTAADFNNDNKPDVAVLANQTLFILLGNGTGQISVSASYILPPSNPLFLAPGDFDRNGLIDVAIANDNVPGTVIVMLNKGVDGFVSAPNPSMRTGWNDSVFTLAVTDLNQDDKPDIISANWSWYISVFLGNGRGGFSRTSGSPIKVKPDYSVPFAVAVADFNGDGHLDVVVSDNSGSANSVAVLVGDGTGTLIPMPGSPFTTGGGASFFVAADDFNMDGKPDIATANVSQNSLSVLLNTGSGFVPAEGSPFATGAVEPRMVISGDFNNDGKPDLAAVNYDSAQAVTYVAVLLNQSGPPPPTINDLRALITTCVSNNTLAASLTVKANASQFRTFITQVQSQMGKQITVPCARQLIGMANYLQSISTDVPRQATATFIPLRR